MRIIKCGDVLEQFDEDRPAMMERAMALGVGHFYLPNIDKNSIAGMLQLEADYPGKCHPMMGLHPCSVGADYEEELAILRTWLEKRPFCAVGEIGLDLFWDKTWFEQIVAFLVPLLLADQIASR